MKTIETRAVDALDIFVPFAGERRGPEPVFEQPWHTHAANYFAAGYTRQQVADACGVTPGTITNLLRAEFFQKMVRRNMDRVAGKDVLDVLKAETLQCVNTLIEIRDNPEAPSSVRANVANSILDRIYGKAVQRIESDSTVRSADPVQEVEQLKAEIERLRN